MEKSPLHTAGQQHTLLHHYFKAAQAVSALIQLYPSKTISSIQRGTFQSSLWPEQVTSPPLRGDAPPLRGDAPLIAARQQGWGELLIRH